jgi:hypothetical protein
VTRRTGERHWQRLAVAACGLCGLLSNVACEQVLGIEDLETTEPPPNGTYWYVPPRADGYSRFEVKVRPMSDPLGAPYGLLNVLQFKLVAPADPAFPLGSLGYVGLHSDPHGKRVEFVIWGARDALGPSARQICDGTALPCAGLFEEDGLHGAQASIAYDWRARRDYKLQVARVLADPAGDWWEASVTELGTRQQTRVGRIQAHPSWQGLSELTTTWFEFYGPNGPECEGSADPQATFHAFRADPGAVLAPWSVGLGALCNFPRRAFDSK